jgi:hypothetical protein
LLVGVMNLLLLLLLLVAAAAAIAAGGGRGVQATHCPKSPLGHFTAQHQVERAR